MLSVHAHAARGLIESHTRSALPDAPVVAPDEPAPAARPRRALAVALLTLADRVSPEPVVRSRWQTG
jgi:hypothetical protein